MSNKNLGKGVVELGAKAHPERFFLLGGAWVAMMMMGIIGGSALVDPDTRLPVIDPLLEAIAIAKQDKAVFTPEEQLELDRHSESGIDVLSSVPLQPQGDIESSETPVAETEVLTVPEVESDIFTEEAEESPVPIETTSRNKVPSWLFLLMITSCLAGSSLITFLLYKVADTKKSIKGKKKRVRKVARKPISASAANQSQRVKIPVVNVPAIAPLKISTPQAVAPPKLDIKPVVDPTPAATPKKSRAAYLAKLAKNAKQQSPKSLVEMMDIRRRNHLAPFS